MHHHSVNKSPSLFSLAAIRSMVSSVFKLSAFHSSVILAPSAVIPELSPVIPANAGIPQIPASRRNDNDASASFAHSQFSILNFKFPSPRLLLTLLILPFIFALDLFYFTLARPGCAACGSLSGFLSTSSLTLTMINQNVTIASAFHSIKTIVARI